VHVIVGNGLNKLLLSDLKVDVTIRVSFACHCYSEKTDRKCGLGAYSVFFRISKTGVNVSVNAVGNESLIVWN